MCGIAGLLAPNPSREMLSGMNDLLAHRGPDDAGIYIGAGVGLAACRLSIIDLTGGHQPLSNEDGSVWVTYNGEIYNAPALRTQLEAAGHRFGTGTDTEVIVHAYEQWGDDLPTRLRGMFAFAVWDAHRRRLLLARDRFGIKPLYYAQHGPRFAFASQVRPLLAALPRLPRRANPTALWHMFGLGFVPSPLSIFDSVHVLPAAHRLVVESGQVSVQRYWQLEYPPAGQHQPIDMPAATEQFMTRLRDAVDAWRLSDVPVGSLLSGGLDSATLAALLTDLSGAPIHTFTIGFAAAAHDETASARETARWLGSYHHELTFSAKDFDHLPEVVRHLEAPQCSATSVPIYLLYKACHAAGFKVIMTGEGADELLGGYHWFDGDRRARPLLRLPRSLRAVLARAPLPVSDAARRVLAHGTRDPLQRYTLWQQVGSAAQLSALLRPLLRPGRAAATQWWDGLPVAGLAERHPLDQFLFIDSQTRMVDFINFEVDRMSMASSIEARPPFLDHELWEFCARLPPEYKLDRQHNKRLLRLGMQGQLPPAVLQRPKRGLASPHADWWRAATLPVWAEECLHPAALAETGYFDAGEVARLRMAHQSGKANFARLLTGVLTTQLWHMEFVTT